MVACPLQLAITSPLTHLSSSPATLDLFSTRESRSLYVTLVRSRLAKKTEVRNKAFYCEFAEKYYLNHFIKISKLIKYVDSSLRFCKEVWIFDKIFPRTSDQCHGWALASFWRFITFLILLFIFNIQINPEYSTKR